MHVQRSWSGDIDYLKVYYRTSSSETWTQLVAYTSAISSWTTEEEIVLPNTTATYQLAFEHTDNYGYGVGLDQVVIIAPSSCPKPTGLNFALTPGDGTVATLSWTSDADAWQICLNGDETNLIPATTNPYTLTGLTPETTYTAKVRANCGSEQSDWSNEVTFTPTNAYSITVNDGTTTNGYVPIYGYYCDASIVSQFIMPAEGLAAMKWGTINKLTFYAAADKDWGAAQFEVYMTEVDYTTFPSTTLVDWTTMDKVMNAASLGISGNQMVVNLDAPYQYTGGNLLIGIKQTVQGEYSSCSWYGVTATGASLGGNNSGSQQNFLPKTTFEFTPGEEPSCFKPTGLAVNYTGGTEATISWTSEATAWNIDVNGTVTAITENPYTLTGLELATNYEVKVQADCGDSQSDWTNAVSFTSDLCTPENQCQISYVLGSTSSYYSGWSYGASISVVDTETNTTIATLNTEGSGTVSVCDGRDIQFVWNSASYSYYNSYCTYTVSDVNGEEIFSGSGAMSTPVNYTVSCTITNCKKPTNVAASQVGPRSAVLSWTENGEATAWVVAYKEATATDFTEVNASTNPFTLEGLTPETAYTVKVKPECDVEKWSDETGFTTTEACPAPTGFAASNITAHTADLAWTGFSESYTVQYRTAAYMDGIEEGFGTSSLPTGWTRYTGLVDNVMAGTATLESATSGWSFDTNNGVFDNHARTNIYGASWNKWLVTPSIEVSGHLSFDLALTAYGGTLAAPETTGTDDRFIVLVSTDEKATWTILREWNNSGSDYVYNDITCSATGESVTIDLSSYMGQTVYIAFYGESTALNADNNLHIDNVTCGAPVPAGQWQTVTVDEAPAILTDLTPETTYEAKVQGNCGEDGESEWATTVFTTDKAYYWNNSETWPENEVPAEYTNVTLPANTQVIVPAGYIAYADTITFGEGASILIENGGQLYHSNEVPVTMQLAYNPNYTSSKDGEPEYGEYRLIAAPVNPGVPVSSTGLVPESTDPNYDYVDLYYFDQNVGELVWINYKNPANDFDSLFIKKGYLYSNAQNVLGIFGGNTLPTSVDVKEPLEYNPDVLWAGWNLVGNPFTCMAFVDRPYYKINGDGNAIAQADGNSLEVFEGVFVLAEQADDSVTFSTTAPNQGGGEPGPEEFKMLTLNLNDGRSLIDRAIVRFDEGRQLLKLQMGSSTKVYIPKDGSDYAIVSSDDTGEMPVSFKAENDGTYTMNFSSENVNFSYLHLIDNKTGDDIDLLETPSYTFTARTNDYTNRFKLVFALGTTGIEESFAFFNNGNLVISNEGNATLQVVDVMGRILKSENINGSASVKVDAAPGVYMIRLTNGSNVKVQKVVVE